jgi:hypothetical protein
MRRSSGRCRGCDPFERLESEPELLVSLARQSRPPGWSENSLLRFFNRRKIVSGELEHSMLFHPCPFGFAPSIFSPALFSRKTTL